MRGAPPLEGMLVIDFSSGIAGGYCTKILADGGAKVIKLEAPSGDPLRRWAIGGSLRRGEDGPLFEFLSCSKRSVVLDPEDPNDVHRAEYFVGEADVVLWSRGSPLAEHEDLRPALCRSLAPHAIVTAITPFGLDGPWSDFPSNDLTLQAWAGGIFTRGTPDRPPVQVGGRPSEWMGGLFAAVGVLTAWQRSVRTGVGELLDVSILEALVLTEQMYATTKQTTTVPGHQPLPERLPIRSVMIPSVESAKDGWVGFMVATATMWESFCVMIGHPEWLEDERLYAYAGRAQRREELEAAIREWVGGHTVAEVLERADLLRVPAAPIGNGQKVTSFDHFLERQFYLRNPKNAYLQPDVPYTLRGGARRRSPGLPPRLGEHSTEEKVYIRTPLFAAPNFEPLALPLEGIRVADFTAFWAGPIVGHFMAMMGADVIHVESAKRPDGMRGHTVRTIADDLWWEWTPQFHGPNTNKRDITLDMNTDRGRQLALRLIGKCDVMLENYAPRVMDQWGFDWDTVSSIRSDLICVRMPAFGLSGPWRNRTGYAQNMEQASGMAWITGFADGPPLVPNGMCDPIAGTHATVALLLAIEHRRKTGEGMLLEVPMVGGAINVAAEQVLEYQAFGHLMRRDGNRGPSAAPQNVYLCAGVELDGQSDRWVAIAIENDKQWTELVRALGHPDWALQPVMATAAGRRSAHDEIDRHLGAWCRKLTDDAIVATLWPLGVPVAKVLAPAEVQHLPQLAARGFLQELRHPVAGVQTHYGYPVRFENGPVWFHRTPAPTLGQHNHDVLVELLGLSEEEFDQLLSDNIIGTQLLGQHRTR